jgi:hypothetical protein
MCSMLPTNVTRSASYEALPNHRLWSAKIPSGGFQRNVTLLHSDRLPSEALCCGKIPSYFEALTDPRDKPIRLTFIYRALSDRAVVIVGCSRFSRCCHLVIALDFLLYEEVGRRHLSPSPELGGRASLEGRRPGFESRRARQFPSLALGTSKRYRNTQRREDEEEGK